MIKFPLEFSIAFDHNLGAVRLRKHIEGGDIEIIIETSDGTVAVAALDNREADEFVEAFVLMVNDGED
jgi:hypothetical protein